MCALGAPRSLDALEELFEGHGMRLFAQESPVSFFGLRLLAHREERVLLARLDPPAVLRPDKHVVIHAVVVEARPVLLHVVVGCIGLGSCLRTRMNNIE